jgi:predicted metal-dependent enzyme (double-stranded beta helix superfamily)
MIDGTARIPELARNLSRARSGDGTNAEVVGWLRAMSGIAAALPQPAQRNPNRQYTRTLLHRCDEFEILVLHWQPGCASSIHDHGGALCWLSVASGDMRVENYVRRDAGATPGYAQIAFDGRETLAAGAVDYRQDDLHLHRCITGDASAISLHVYAHPIDRFHCFDERAQTCSETISTYDAILTAQP